MLIHLNKDIAVRVILGLFTIIFSLSAFAQSYEGRSARVIVDGEAHEFEIALNQDGIPTLLKNGQDTEQIHPAKVFSYKTSSDEHLMVWFKNEGEGFWDHHSGIYLYKPWNFVNKWDHLEFLDGFYEPRTKSIVMDVVKHNGKIVILRQIVRDIILRKEHSYTGYIQHIKGNTLFPNGYLSSKKLNFIPERFIQDGGNLYIVGFDREEKTYKEYLYQGVDKTPKYLSTL